MLFLVSGVRDWYFSYGYKLISLLSVPVCLEHKLKHAVSQVESWGSLVLSLMIYCWIFRLMNSIVSTLSRARPWSCMPIVAKFVVFFLKSSDHFKLESEHFSPPTSCLYVIFICHWIDLNCFSCPKKGYQFFLAPPSLTNSHIQH